MNQIVVRDPLKVLYRNAIQGFPIHGDVTIVDIEPAQLLACDSEIALQATFESIFIAYGLSLSTNSNPVTLMMFSTERLIWSFQRSLGDFANIK